MPRRTFNTGFRSSAPPPQKTTAPDSLKRAVTRTPKFEGHDPLHIFVPAPVPIAKASRRKSASHEQQEPPETRSPEPPEHPEHPELVRSSLRYCWCMCKKCWEPRMRRCICRDCTCNQNRERYPFIL